MTAHITINTAQIIIPFASIIFVIIIWLIAARYVNERLYNNTLTGNQLSIIELTAAKTMTLAPPGSSMD
jgi:hypothetical protein